MSNDRIRPFKSLMVEDRLIDRKQLERLLSKSILPSFEIKHTEYLENPFALLNTDDFDTAIPDLNLPDSSGLDTVGKTKRPRFEVGLILIETVVSTIALMLIVTRVVGAFECGNDSASCTHKPDLQVTAAHTESLQQRESLQQIKLLQQKDLLQQHIIPADTIIEQAIK